MSSRRRPSLKAIAERDQRIADLERELLNVKALAKRMRHRGDSENAGHLLRFCARVGLGESPMDILREDRNG